AGEAVAHDQVRASAQLLDEAVERGEIIGVVGVAHDDVAAVRRGDTAAQGSPVAALGDSNDARTQAFSDRLRSIGGAVVGDQHLTGDSRLRQVALRLPNTGADGLRLVEAWHQDGQLQLGRAGLRGNALRFRGGVHVAGTSGLEAPHGHVTGTLPVNAWCMVNTDSGLPPKRRQIRASTGIRRCANSAMPGKPGVLSCRSKSPSRWTTSPPSTSRATRRSRCRWRRSDVGTSFTTTRRTG